METVNVNKKNKKKNPQPTLFSNNDNTDVIIIIKSYFQFKTCKTSFIAVYNTVDDFSFMETLKCESCA